MASFVDKLRAVIGLKPKAKKGGNDFPKSDRIGAFRTLNEKFLACEDMQQKAEIWAQMCKILPDTLFLAAMCYDGDDPHTASRDRELHATVGAKRLYGSNTQITVHGNPGYRVAKKADDRRIHLRTLIYQKSKEVWVPLFTDFSGVLPMFGANSRMTIISFEEARQMAKSYQGIVINPGKHAIHLDNSLMKKAL